MKKMILLLSILAGNISLFAQKDPYLLQNIKNSNEVNCVAFSPDGTRIIAGFSNGTARIIDLASEKTEIEVKGHWKASQRCCIRSEGKILSDCR